MKWRAQPKRGLAYSDCDYMLAWSEHPETKKQWFNAWTPSTKNDLDRRCIEAGFDLQKCKDACEAHLRSRQANVVSAREVA